MPPSAPRAPIAADLVEPAPLMPLPTGVGEGQHRLELAAVPHLRTAPADRPGHRALPSGPSADDRSVGPRGVHAIRSIWIGGSRSSVWTYDHAGGPWKVPAARAWPFIRIDEGAVAGCR